MNQIIDLSAARQTLSLKAHATGIEAEDARKAMQETEQGAQKKAEQIVRDMLSQARVWVSGGIQCDGSFLRDKLEDACSKMLLRQYPDFAKGDNSGWGQVINLCKQGTANVCPVLAYNGNPLDHPVVRLVLNRIGASAKWQDVTIYFDDTPYGWPTDTTVGALYLLWALNAIEIYLAPPAIPALATTDRRELRKSSISTQLVVVTVEDKIKFRGIMQALDPKGPNSAGKELEQEQEGFTALLAQYETSGSAAPAAAPEKLAILEEAGAKNPGSERLKYLAEHAPAFKQAIANWIEKRDRLQTRMLHWQRLQNLLAHANGLAELAVYKEQSAALYANRSLLDQPDPVQPLLRQASEQFRVHVNKAWQEWQSVFMAELAQIALDADWQRADAASRTTWLTKHGIKELVKPELGTDEKVLHSLEQQSLSSWQDQTDALAGRFSKLRSDLVQARQPKAQPMAVQRAVISNQADLDTYITKLREQVEPALAHGPVILE